MKLLPLMPLSLIMLSAPAYSNDSYGGITTAGLLFQKTDAISMVKEDLYISPEKITVDYVFKNNTDQDVSGEVIFPLPMFSPAQAYHSPSPMSETHDIKNPYNFTVTIDGKPVDVSLDVVAMLVEYPPYDPDAEITEPEAELNDPLKDWAQIDFLPEGQDITAKLKEYAIPLSLSVEDSQAQLSKLAPEVLEKLIADEWVYIEGEGEDQMIVPNWELGLRYHWSQTFPANATLNVSHSYDANPGGMLLMDTATLKTETSFVADYCISDAEYENVAKVMQASGEDGFAFGNDVTYILRSANSWAGPIQDFRLTVDYLKPENTVVFCAEGKVQASPTTIVVERKDFTPAQDLDLMFVSPGLLEQADQ